VTVNLDREEFPRSSRYDPAWVFAGEMGINALWLTEWLCEALELRPGMRVLDLGCGRVLSSVFLAREFGVQVWATDLWIPAGENLARITEAGLDGQIFPLHADARALPYAPDFFDAIVCVDAYIYFGTDDLYLKNLHRFVKPGGQIGVVVPGFVREPDGDLPDHLRPFWDQDCWTWHDAAWWERHWSRTGLVEVEVADTMPRGHEAWLQWYRAREAAGHGSSTTGSDIEVLAEDGGRYMGILRVVARRTAAAPSS
jgi:cyclopropane fatty-acyl-phospholipid synthase-like methyltransferase